MISLNEFSSWLHARVAYLEMNIASPCIYLDKGELWDKRQQVLDTLDHVTEYEGIWTNRGLGCPHINDKVSD